MSAQPLPDRPKMAIAPPPAAAPPARRARRQWVLPVGLFAVVAAGYAAVHWLPQFAGSDGGSSRRSAGPVGRAVPVVAALAQRGDLPIYLNGLGTVTAFNMVTVRARVEGQLVK